MATRMLPTSKAWFCVLIVTIAMDAGCQTAHRGGCCGDRSASTRTPPPEPAPIVPPAPPAGNASYGGQKTCPVTGEALGSMGAPIPVTVEGQTIYVCCRGCATRVQRDPATYLQKVAVERGRN